MYTKTSIYLAATTVLLGAREIGAQNACSGPGASFGVTSYQCASCAIKQTSGNRTEFIFHAEPLLLQTSASSALREGDVIEAVNGKPITTREGAELFTYPAKGEWPITVRRGGSRATVSARAAISCPGSEQPKSAEASKLGVAIDPEASAVPKTNRFGFGVGCVPSCTYTHTVREGDYWKFDGPPKVVVVESDSPADKAGMQVGDLILDVDGKSVLQDEGALRLQRSLRAKNLRLTVQRANGKKARYSLQARSDSWQESENCGEARALVVRNETAQTADVYWVRWDASDRRTREVLGTAGPGRSEFTLPPKVPGTREYFEQVRSDVARSPSGALPIIGGFGGAARITLTVECR